MSTASPAGRMSKVSPKQAADLLQALQRSQILNLQVPLATIVEQIGAVNTNGDDNWYVIAGSHYVLVCGEKDLGAEAERAT